MLAVKEQYRMEITHPQVVVGTAVATVKAMEQAAQSVAAVAALMCD
jgi:hypothetical protein